MRFLAVSLRKDWARVVRDPSQFAIALGIPLVLAVLMSLVFGRAPAAPHGLLLVDDEDGTVASDQLLGFFRRGPLRTMLTIQNVSRAGGRARIERGDASAFLIIPKGLQIAFARRQPFHLQLVTNPSQQIVPQMVEETLATTLDGAFYLRRIAGNDYTMFATGTLPPELTRYFNPPLMGIESSAARPAQTRPARSFAAVFLPSMLFMGLLFLASGTAADIWRERTAGTLRRLATSPVSLAWYLGARVVFVALLYAVVSTGGLFAAQRLAGMPVPNLAAAAGWMTFVGTVFYLLFLAIAVQADTPRAASVLANLIIFPLAMLGGCFFPFDWMPAWMVTIGKLTPNGWAIATFQTILSGAAHAAQVAVPAAVLAGVGALAFALALRRFRQGFVV